MGEEFFEVVVGLAHLHHLDGLAGKEGEVVAVVEGDGVVGDVDVSVEPSGAVDGEAQGGLGAGAGGDVEGRQGTFAATDGELDRQFLYVVAAAVADGGIDGDAAADEVGGASRVMVSMVRLSVATPSSGTSM